MANQTLKQIYDSNPVTAIAADSLIYLSLSPYTSGNDAAMIGSVFNSLYAPLSAKGDIYTYSTTNDRLPVGADNQFLQSNSATATGLNWVSPGALTKVDDTNVTLTLGGTPATALLQATSLTLGWTGQLSLARGGTNKNITSDNGAIVYCDSDSFELLASTATAGQILRSGSSSAPSWSTATYPATAGTSGNVLTSDGTNWVSGSPPVVLGNFQQNFLVGGM